MAERCLHCYQLLEDGQHDYHPTCSRKFFGKPTPPLLDFTEAQMLELAQRVIRSQHVVTGVQPKLSLDIERTKPDAPQRFTVVGLWGTYILKPPSEVFENLPQNEDLTMHLATLAGIQTVPHALIRLKSGNLAYITKRIDRVKKTKLHMEDMCQLTERLTEHKYNGSYEQIAKVILKHSTNPLLDAINFYEQVLFSFLTGNADMHLKNFSVIKQPDIGYVLAPAYDILSTKLVMPNDNEELALTLNGKKARLKQSDFRTAMDKANIPVKSQDNVFSKFKSSVRPWFDFIDISFLPDDFRVVYKELVNGKLRQLEL